MADRTDIKDGLLDLDEFYGLIYTRKCGWIDLGHANPQKGANVLWRKIKRDPPLPKRSPNSNTKIIKQSKFDDFTSFKISYEQKMVYEGKIFTGVRRWFRVKRNLTMKERKAVALAILINVSLEFEAYQGYWPYIFFTNSSFSCEDLISNVLSLYRAINPGRRYLEMCEPVAKEEALAIWDKFGSPGKYKNRVLRPLLFPLNGNGSPRYGQLPAFLNRIKPAKPGWLFCEVKHGFTDKFFGIG